MVSRISPDIVILEIGTNDLSHSNPGVVDSEIEELVHLLLQTFPVPVVGVCHVTPRNDNSNFNAKALVLNQYVRVVLDDMSSVFCWTHKGFSTPSQTRFLPDGVHFNRIG